MEALTCPTAWLPVGDYFNGPAVDVQPVPPLANDAQARADVVASAAVAFTRALGRPAMSADAVSAGVVNGALEGETYDRVLFLLLRALASVEGVDAAHEGAMLDFALRREQRFWDEGLEELGLPMLKGRPVMQAAAVATLAGSVSTPEAATSLLLRAPLLADQPAAVRAKVAELLHRLYPGRDWLVGVQPDLLGEHLVGRALEGDPGLLGVFHGA